jgi:hypothetical protein
VQDNAPVTVLGSCEVDPTSGFFNIFVVLISGVKQFGLKARKSRPGMDERSSAYDMVAGASFRGYATMLVDRYPPKDLTRFATIV